MTKDQIKEVLDRVLTWPPERQEDAARVLAEMEQQDASPYHLTDEQAEEVRRRLADPDPRSMTMAEVRSSLRQLRNESHLPPVGLCRS
jgi:hypothetical protein